MSKAPERRHRNHRQSIYADVIVELTQMTFRGLLPTVLVTGAGLFGTIGFLAWYYRDPQLYAAAALLLVCTTLRAAAIAVFNRSSRPLTLRAAFRWQGLYAALTFGYCAAMALSTLESFRFHGPTAWVLNILGCFLLCGGFSARTGLHPRILQISGLILLLALAVALILSRDSLARTGLLLILLFSITYCHSVQSKFDIIVEQMRSRRTLSLLTDHDPLTGLFNRRHFEASLATLLLAETPFAILFIDLQRFKAVNDNYSHAVGDVILQRVGIRLKASVRRGDLVARLDGDEFAILQMADASLQAAESLARRISRAIEATFEVEGNQIQIGSNVGIRLSDSDQDAQALLDKADAALYRSNQASGSALGSNRSPAA